MIEMGMSFFKEIYNEDIIYHYTKGSTAIDYILFNKQLKFSKRNMSIDPTESLEASRGSQVTGGNTDIKKGKRFYDNCNKLAATVSRLEKEFYQICFCKNDPDHEFSNEFYHTQFHGHEEIFGFTKPRMWERYADNYHGVCLAFSKRKLLALNRKKLKLICNDVEYLKYIDLGCRKVDYISGDYLIKAGYAKYLKEIKARSELSFFCKHLDYEGEREFRIGTYFQEKNCIAEKIDGKFIFGETIMLDVKGCIEAIFVSNYANTNQKRTLLQYSEKLKVPIIEMVWKHDSFQPEDYKQTTSLFAKITIGKSSP